MFCEYKNAFGKVGHGAHAYRLFDFAIIDVIIMLIAALCISKFSNKGFVPVVFMLFLSSILSHRVFCVRSTVDKTLFK